MTIESAIGCLGFQESTQGRMESHNLHATCKQCDDTLCDIAGNDPNVSVAWKQPVIKYVWQQRYLKLKVKRSRYVKSYDIGFKLVDSLTLIHITSMCDFIRQNVNCYELNICIHKLKKQTLMFYNEKKNSAQFWHVSFPGVSRQLLSYISHAAVQHRAWTRSHQHNTSYGCTVI